MKQFFRKPWFLLTTPGAILTMVWLAGCHAKPESTQRGSPALPSASVRLLVIQDKSQTNMEEIVGTVRPKLQSILEANLNGRIAKLPVVLGQQIKAGDLLVLLDAGEINARLEQAEASLEQADRDWKRASGLFKQQAITRADYDTAQSRNRIAAAAAVEARAVMSYVRIVAPFDGVVTKKWADVGDLATPGKPLISIEDPSTLQLEANVPQGIAAQIKANDRLAVRMDAMTKELNGTVSEISPAADPISRTFRVKVDLPEAGGTGSGQFGRLLVPTGRSNVLTVPRSAMVQRGQLDIVFTVSNQHAQLHLVKTGKANGDEVEILSGLHPGDTVVVDGAAQLTDGQPVEAK